MKKKCLLLSLLLVITLFSGCGGSEDMGQNNNESDAPSEANAPDGESLLFMTELDIHATEDGYYIGGNTIKFYSFETETSFVVCSQPGCSHTDSECSAYLGSQASYAVYHDAFYAIEMSWSSNSTARIYTIKSREVSDTSWNTLWEYNETPYAGDNIQARIGGGYIAILINEFVLEGDETITYSQLVAIDLQTGEVSKIMPTTKLLMGGYNLWGVAEGSAIVSFSGFSEEVYNYDEYAANADEDNNSVEDWYLYLDDRRTEKYICYDLSFGEATIIAEGDRDALMALTDPHVVYNGRFYYYHNGSFMSYDIKNGLTSELMSTSDVINLVVLDGKLFYIIKDAEGVFDVRYYDLETGQDSKLKNGTIDTGIVFGVFEENGTMFFGLYNGVRHVISKDDFYAGLYEKATERDSY